MWSKIGWGIFIVAIIALFGVAFFQKYQIVPRVMPVASPNTAPISPLPMSVSTTVPTVAVIAPISFDSMDVSEETASYTIKAFYPRLNGGDAKTAESFNLEIKAIIDRYVGDFKQFASGSSPIPNTKSSLTIAYDIKYQGDQLISVLLSAEQYIAGAAHPSHPMTSYNFDLKSNRAIALKELFLPDSKYLEAISEYARAELRRRNSKTPFTTESELRAGTDPKKDFVSVFNPSSDGLLITFPEVTIAPYVAGAISVNIPWNVLTNLRDAKYNI